MCLKDFINNFHLLDHLDKIGEIMNDAVNIHSLEKKLDHIDGALRELKIETQEHGLPNNQGITYLITGVSIDKLQQDLDEHLTSV